VIDEISMLTKDLLEKLDDIGRRMRKCDKPFGSIQLLLVGDFCQLPPVKELNFAFESARWPTIVSKVIELVEVQRQKDKKVIAEVKKMLGGEEARPKKILPGACLKTGDGRKARAEIVKAYMQKHGCKMIEASRKVKELGLYKK
jgi:hypothetical protein